MTNNEIQAAAMTFAEVLSENNASYGSHAADMGEGLMVVRNWIAKAPKAAVSAINAEDLGECLATVQCQPGENPFAYRFPRNLAEKALEAAK